MTPSLRPEGTFPDATKETVLLPWRLALGAFWTRAGVEKIIRADWWDGDDVRAFLARQHDEALWFWRPVMEHVFSPNAVIVSVIVVLAELIIGPAILFNIGQVTALRIGVLLNVLFVFCGAVNPSVFYILGEMTLLLAWTDRAIGRKPTRARRYVAGLALGWLGLAALFVPFIRTVEPVELIADPASTLSLVAGIMGATFARRWWICRRDDSMRRTGL